MIKKNMVVGLGEIGLPIYKLISKKIPTASYDINPKLINKKNNKKYEKSDISLLHVCIPFSKRFLKDVVLIFKKFNPEGIVIHSTISPHTTERLQSTLSIPIIYSATRGVHKRMLKDLKRYTKFFAIEKNAPKKNWAISTYKNLLKKCGVQVKQMSSPITLELAKIICDTSYYGWLINYAQLSNMIAIKNHVNYDEMWSFADEIHKILGNRPKMFPGFIGGHCVIPNLELIQSEKLDLIKKINNDYSRKKIRNIKKSK